MLTTNIFITPLYFNMSRQVVIDMLPTVFLPFNLFKSILNASLMLLVHKPFVSALRYAGFEKKSEVTKYKFRKKSLILTISALVLLIVAIAFIVSLGIEINFVNFFNFLM